MGCFCAEDAVHGACGVPGVPLLRTETTVALSLLVPQFGAALNRVPSLDGYELGLTGRRSRPRFTLFGTLERVHGWRIFSVPNRDTRLAGCLCAEEAVHWSNGQVEFTARQKVKHYDEPGDAHFLTFSCYRRWPLLSKDRTRLWFVQAASEARVRHEFDLWAWVIMPEHVHVLIWPRQAEYKTQRILSAIKQPVGTKAIDYLRRHNTAFLERLTVRHRNRTYHRFWQAGPGRDHNLYEAKAIHEAIDYIHQNPVRRGLVTKAEDWLWSSARDWAGLGAIYLPVDRTVPTLHFGD